MISLMVMRYSQFSGARPIHWVKAGEVRGCDLSRLAAAIYFFSFRSPIAQRYDEVRMKS